MSAREIAVVIPSLGNHEVLGRVLDSLRDQHPLGRFEVVVVLDAADPDPERAERLCAGLPFTVRVLRGERPGASANRNVGWRSTRSPLILFIDNDTLARPGLLDEHLAWHQRHPGREVGVLGHVRWANELRVTPFMHWLDHGIQFDYPNIEGTEAGWGRFYSANASVKRSLLEAVGGFDEVRLPYLYEDLDLAYRATRHGFRLLYNPRAEVEHLRPMDLEFWRRKMPRLAAAERSFTCIHPEIAPYFANLFRAAAASLGARGRGRHLIKLIPRRAPLLGERVWASADLYYRQALAPDFLDAWARLESTGEQHPPANNRHSS